jgi:hypothetical protein
MWLLLAAIPAVAWPRPQPSVGPPESRPTCPAWIEKGGRVLCTPGARSGDRIDSDGRRSRMAPARLAALGVPVDLNRASVAELMSLDGVGAKLAERIVAARPFVTVDDVLRVRGIGVRRLSTLRPRLSVSLDD